MTKPKPNISDEEFWRTAQQAHQFRAQEFSRCGKWLIILSIILIVFAVGGLNVSELTISGAKIDVPPKWLIVLMLLFAQISFCALFTLAVLMTPVLWGLYIQSPYYKRATELASAELHPGLIRVGRFQNWIS